MDELGIRIGNKVKELREKKGDSLRTVGETLGIDYSYLGKIEKGKKPSIKLLEKIADYFNVNVKYFMEEDLNDEEKSLLQDLHLTPEQLASKYDLVIDGKKASKEEIRIAIETIRMLRHNLKREG